MGIGLCRSVCRGRHSLRACRRERTRHALRLCRDAPRRAAAAGCRRAADRADDRLPRRSGQDRQPTKRRADPGASRHGHRAGEARRAGPGSQTAMPIREPAISIAPALFGSNYGWCTAGVTRGRAAAATGPTPIRTDPMRHERCSAFSAIIPGRVLANLVMVVNLMGNEVASVGWVERRRSPSRNRVWLLERKLSRSHRQLLDDVLGDRVAQRLGQR